MVDDAMIRCDGIISVDKCRVGGGGDDDDDVSAEDGGGGGRYSWSLRIELLSVVVVVVVIILATSDVPVTVVSSIFS
jgi:hypothetical protein